MIRLLLSWLDRRIDARIDARERAATAYRRETVAPGQLAEFDRNEQAYRQRLAQNREHF